MCVIKVPFSDYIFRVSRSLLHTDHLRGKREKDFFSLGRLIPESDVSPLSYGRHPRQVSPTCALNPWASNTPLFILLADRILAQQLLGWPYSRTSGSGSCPFVFSALIGGITESGLLGVCGSEPHRGLQPPVLGPL